MRVNNAVRKAADPRPLTMGPARASTMPGADSVEKLAERELLEQVERIAGHVEHAAAVCDSLADADLGPESLRLLTNEREAIARGFSSLLAIYGAELRFAIDVYQRLYKDELKAG